MRQGKMSYHSPPSNSAMGFYTPQNNQQMNYQGLRPGPFPTDDHYGPSVEYQLPNRNELSGQYPPPPPMYAPPREYPFPASLPGQGQYLPVGHYPPPEQHPPHGYGQTYGHPGYAEPSTIIRQPTMHNMGDWTNISQGPPNCPPGLGYLMSVSSLFVKQKVELLEAFTGFETKNKYTIKNQQGDNLYYAVEESDCCTRNFCGPLRPFDMKISDADKNEIIHLNRALACDVCWFPCCLQKMEVSAPPGNVIGTIEQVWSVLTPEFSIKDAVGETVLKVKGPLCTFSICGAVEFKVLSKDGQHEVGKISKEWSGFFRELFTDADCFGVSFPQDLDVRIKAVMIGAVFLIDAMFFEKKGHKETVRSGML